MAQTAARQGGARARSRHAAALKDQGKGAALTCFVASTRARGADRAAAAAAAASTAVADSFFANSGSRIGAHAGAAAGDGAGQAERGTGRSPTRWPKPQHGKGALALARATLRL